jgi:2,4-dienoyl-CoA reductase-like NADH-dependent reductase (Old Yellow Enzyme family)
MSKATNTTADNAETKYPSVFRKLEIGRVSLPNRIAFPAFQFNYATTDGKVSEKLLDVYTALAEGGCGLIFTGCAVVSPDTVAFDRVMRIDSDQYIPGLKKLFSEIETYGSVPGIQIVHYGRQALNAVTGHDLLAPSAIPCPVMSQYDPNYYVREMTSEDIVKTRDDFITAAARSVDAGAKIVEVHVAHGYLLNEFLSPYSNKRTDDYGGSVENRARLITEIIEGIRTNLQQKVVIGVRVSGHEFVDGGLTPPDFAEIIPLFENAGMDLLNVAAGVYESMERIVPPVSLGEAPHIEVAAELKQYANVPVCCVGSIFSLEKAESIISSGEADLVAMGRAQVADPEIVAKSASGREAEIRKCTWCNTCTFWTTGDPEMYCTVNPLLKKKG